MTDPIPNSAASEAPQDRDALARFLLPEAGVRGVRVHLDDAWAQIRARASDVPAAAVELLGEAAAASALFTGHAKVDGRLSVQLRGTGALRTLFAECTAASRAHCAGVSADASRPNQVRAAACAP
jgi:molecular chaperone Hsp33